MRDLPSMRGAAMRFKPKSSTTRTPHRLGAIAHLLSASQLRETTKLAAQPAPGVSLLAGVQAALTTAFALPLVLNSRWEHLVGFAALGCLVALFGRFARPAQRLKLVMLAALMQASSVLIMSLTVWAGVGIGGQIVVLAALSAIFYFLSVVARLGPPGALIFIFAASASMSPVSALSQVMERFSATSAIALLAVAVCFATERLRRRIAAARDLPVDIIGPRTDIMAAALKIAVGAGLAASLAHALGAAHPGWAAMGAVAVLQGGHLHIRMNRALQRTAGTIVGAALVWLFLSLEPSPAVTIIALVIMTIATEVVIGVNYAFGQMFVTPMALLMTYLAYPAPSVEPLVVERVADTIVGALVGIVIALALSSLQDRRLLRRHHVRRTRSK